MTVQGVSSNTSPATLAVESFNGDRRSNSDIRSEFSFNTAWKHGGVNLRSSVNLLQPSSIDTIKQLDEACSHLERLINDVGAYVNWWDLRVVDLTSIKNFALLTSNNDNDIAKRSVADRWQKINADFTNYKQQVICAFHFT